MDYALTVLYHNIGVLIFRSSNPRHIDKKQHATSRWRKYTYTYR